MKHALALSLVTLVAACVTDTETETEPEVDSTARIVINGLKASDLLANEGELNALGGASLSASVTHSELRNSDGGRSVLSYLAGCALTSAQSLSITAADGSHHTYPGSVGLAPGWLGAAPTVSQQRWVTACILARTNLYGVHVDLSMRGPNPALTAGLAEGLGYLLTEGAFWGNLFAASGPTAHACLTLVKSTGLSLSTMSARACAASAGDGSTQCGFAFEGSCGLLDVNLAPACNGLLPPYTKCKGDGIRYDEVITVDLATL